VVEQTRGIRKRSSDDGKKALLCSIHETISAKTSGKTNSNLTRNEAQREQEKRQETASPNYT
jgi:hypothetical protein